MIAKKLIIVTGANKGIGYALVEKLLQHKDKPNVIMTYSALGEEAYGNLVKKYPSEKDRLLTRELDLSSDTSISEFANWLHTTHQSFDVLINNAAVGDVNDIKKVKEFSLPPEQVKQFIQTNYHSTIKVTEALLPFLSDDGKIIMMSTFVAKLAMQGEATKDFLNDPNVTKDALDKKLTEFEEKAIKGEQEAAGFSKSVYSTTKAFLNAYTRFILPPKLKGNQTCFSLYPGWCKTSIGTQDAPMTPEQGTLSTLTVLDFDLETSQQNNTKLIDEKGNFTTY